MLVFRQDENKIQFVKIDRETLSVTKTALNLTSLAHHDFFLELRLFLVNPLRLQVWRLRNSLPLLIGKKIMCHTLK